MEECTTNEACTEKDKNYDDRATIFSGKYLKSLVKIPTGKSMQDQLSELKESKNVCACFESAIHHQLNV